MTDPDQRRGHRVACVDLSPIAELVTARPACKMDSRCSRPDGIGLYFEVDRSLAEVTAVQQLWGMV